MTLSKVVTYASPAGAKINISPRQEVELLRRRLWPKDSSGREYAEVSHGLHRGEAMTMAELLLLSGVTGDSASVPPTKEAAVQALVDGDVAEWGESERAASLRQHNSRSYGRALNTLANRAEMSDAPDPELRAAANAALTSADWAELHEGG